MTRAIAEIMKSPQAALIAEQLNTALAEEAKHRDSFREWVDDSMKAEFINGEIVVHSPVKRRHWKASNHLATLLSVYNAVKGLGEVGVEKVMVALTRNDYEPDICFFSKEKTRHLTEDTMFHPTPDFVVEILSKRTAKTDRTTKKDDYAAHGVQEYWIVDTNSQTVEQYLLLEPGDKTYFEPYRYTLGEDISSRVITGFTLPVRAIFEEEANVKALRELMQQG